jgi:hypothetical protein
MANLVVWLSVGWLGLSASAQAEQATVSPVQPTDVAGLDIDQLVKIKVSPFDVSRQIYSNRDDTGEAQAVGLTASL